MLDTKFYQKKRDELLALLDEARTLPHLQPRECERLENISRNLRESQFKIVLVGNFQGGKSTTFNLLCGGMEISPRGNNIKTSASIITARHSVDKTERGTAEIVWKNEDQILKFLAENLKGFLGTDSPPKTLEEWHSLFPKVLGYFRQLYDNKADADLRDPVCIALLMLKYHDSQSLDAAKKKPWVKVNELRPYACFPERWNEGWEQVATSDDFPFSAGESLFVFVDRIDCRIDSPALMRTGSVVIDCPGLDASSYDSAVAMDVIRSADAVWYLLGSQAISDQEVARIKKIIQECGKDRSTFFFTANIRNAKKLALEETIPASLSKLNQTGLFEPPLQLDDVVPYHALLALESEFCRRFKAGTLDEGSKGSILRLTGNSESPLEDVFKYHVREYIKVIGGMSRIELKKFSVLESEENIKKALELSGFEDILTRIESEIITRKAASILVKNGSRIVVDTLKVAEAALFDKQSAVMKRATKLAETYQCAKSRLEVFFRICQLNLNLSEPEIDELVAAVAGNNVNGEILQDKVAIEFVWRIKRLALIWENILHQNALLSSLFVKKPIFDQEQTSLVHLTRMVQRITSSCEEKGVYNIRILFTELGDSLFEETKPIFAECEKSLNEFKVLQDKKIDEEYAQIASVTQEMVVLRDKKFQPLISAVKGYESTIRQECPLYLFPPISLAGATNEQLLRRYKWQVSSMLPYLTWGLTTYSSAKKHDDVEPPHFNFSIQDVSDQLVGGCRVNLVNGRLASSCYRKTSLTAEKPSYDERRQCFNYAIAVLKALNDHLVAKPLDTTAIKEVIDSLQSELPELARRSLTVKLVKPLETPESTEVTNTDGGESKISASLRRLGIKQVCDKLSTSVRERFRKTWGKNLLDQAVYSTFQKESASLAKKLIFAAENLEASALRMINSIDRSKIRFINLLTRVGAIGKKDYDGTIKLLTTLGKIERSEIELVLRFCESVESFRRELNGYIVDGLRLLNAVIYAEYKTVFGAEYAQGSQATGGLGKLPVRVLCSKRNGFVRFIHSGWTLCWWGSVRLFAEQVGGQKKKGKNNWIFWIPGFALAGIFHLLVKCIPHGREKVIRLNAAVVGEHKDTISSCISQADIESIGDDVKVEDAVRVARIVFESSRNGAELGDASAQFTLGFCYEKGKGVEKNLWEAAKWYRLAAAQGHVNAQYTLGLCYLLGQGVEKDFATAAQWHLKAANQGYADAQYLLGMMYENGEGVAKDSALAVHWYRKAAEQGQTSAQFCLGVCYANGEGVAKDQSVAVQWYHKAAESGLANAQYNLGVCYDFGRGVEKDQTIAVQWYYRAAEQGHAKAQYNLGVCYAKGEGVAQDQAISVQWYRKAAEQGHVKAKNALAARRA